MVALALIQSNSINSGEMIVRAVRRGWILATFEDEVHSFLA